MSKNWKPGDVAMVNDCTRPEESWKAATCKEAAVPGRRETVWILHESGARVWGSVSEARPLVVIDPEDREQVDRLGTIRDEMYERMHPDEYDSTPEIDDDADTDLLQAALREFANPTPTKPDEPIGLGAVVEDAKGTQWVRIGENGQRGYDDWKRAGAPSGDWCTYADIDAVRVLSDGVQA